ncbi:MAG: helix-turn-helix transcriptional regulator, partial [bacterium]
MNDDFPILAAVAANPTHPYALLEHLNELGIPATRSTLYRRVEALVAQGWLDADDIRGESGHLRRALTLTPAGRERLDRESADALRTEPLESPLFALAIGGANSNRLAELAGVLRPRMATAARRLTEEEHALKSSTEENLDATRTRRIAHLQADISWLQGLLGRRTVE